MDVSCIGLKGVCDNFVLVRFHSVNCVGFAFWSRCKLKKELCESDNFKQSTDFIFDRLFLIKTSTGAMKTKIVKSFLNRFL